MVKIVGVRFKKAGKVYYFDPPGELDLAAGDDVIVETARGVEFGQVVSRAQVVDEEEIVQPLKQVIRGGATDADRRQVEENKKKRNEPSILGSKRLRRMAFP